ncbi:hypothetical protein HPP92_027503 [Vanilla planifolia]|uniref:Uncharacterized protein n=1 Tax=Vanilla planifolia TaxID=51239 RepID=A0A835U7J3_VANPL|nr:hypothetical protein HPP92_027503 [Vanilla planifolia]
MVNYWWDEATEYDMEDLWKWRNSGEDLGELIDLGGRKRLERLMRGSSYLPLRRKPTMVVC